MERRDKVTIEFETLGADIFAEQFKELKKITDESTQALANYNEQLEKMKQLMGEIADISDNSKSNNAEAKEKLSKLLMEMFGRY